MCLCVILKGSLRALFALFTYKSFFLDLHFSFSSSTFPRLGINMPSRDLDLQ